MGSVNYTRLADNLSRQDHHALFHVYWYYASALPLLIVSSWSTRGYDASALPLLLVSFGSIRGYDASVLPPLLQGMP
jgi:hypothetical protein